ncbi:MAG: hypothetical protein JNG86_11305 [Verrucomicrobiaceae bacterium]|nr:hypothetical protein [Verrucomicrobiaceae bacterium]
MQVNLAALTTSSPLLGQRFQQAIPAVDRISHQAMSQLRSLVNSGAVTISRSGDGAQQVSGATLQIGGGSGGYTLGGEGLTLSLSPNLIQVARDSSNAVGGTVKVPASSATAVPSTGSSQSVTGSGSGSMPAESRLLISSSGVNLSGGNLVLDAGAANLTKQGASVQMSSGLATQAGGIPPQSPELTPRFVSSGSVSASSGVTNVGSSDIAALLSSSMIPIGTRGVPGNAVPAGNLTLNSGTLILTSQQAAAFLSGGGQVIGAGGTPLTPVTNPDGSLTFSN